MIKITRLKSKRGGDKAVDFGFVYNIDKNTWKYMIEMLKKKLQSCSDNRY